MSRLKEITARRPILGSALVMRTLSCGHEQVEKKGGKSPVAHHARCAVCDAAERAAKIARQLRGAR